MPWDPMVLGHQHTKCWLHVDMSFFQVSLVTMISDYLLMTGGFLKTYMSLKIWELFNFQNCIKLVSFIVWVRYFPWKFQRYPFKFHTKCLIRTFKGVQFVEKWRFYRSLMYELISILIRPPDVIPNGWRDLKKSSHTSRTDRRMTFYKPQYSEKWPVNPSSNAMGINHLFN